MSELHAQPRQRRPKASAGAAGIISVAERLFGEQGISAVSLRQVAAASGLANHFSVQYHFGDRNGLLRAIFQARLPSLDRRRSELVDMLSTDERVNIATLFDCINRPFLEAAMYPDKSCFAKLLVQVLRNPEYRSIREDYYFLSPCGMKLTEIMHGLMPHLARDIFILRQTIAVNIVLEAIADPTMFGLLSGPKEADLHLAYETSTKIALGCLMAKP